MGRSRMRLPPSRRRQSHDLCAADKVWSRVYCDYSALRYPSLVAPTIVESSQSLVVDDEESGSLSLEAKRPVEIGRSYWVEAFSGAGGIHRASKMNP